MLDLKYEANFLPRGKIFLRTTYFTFPIMGIIENKMSIISKTTAKSIDLKSNFTRLIQFNSENWILVGCNYE